MLQDILKEFSELCEKQGFGISYEVDMQDYNESITNLKDFIAHTYNTAFEDGREEGQNTTTSILIPSLEPKDNVKELQKRIQTIEIINIKKEARKELIEEILREMPLKRELERVKVSAMCYGFEWNQYRDNMLDLLNKKI